MRDFILFVMQNIALVGLFTVILLLILLLSILITPYIANTKFRMYFNRGYARMNELHNEKKLLKQVKKYTSVKIKMSKLDKMEIHYIDKTTIRNYIKFFNIYFLFALSIIAFIAAFQPVYKLTLSLISAILISFMLASFPFLVFEVWGRSNTEKVRRKLANFVSSLHRWCCVKEDIVYAFEKSIDSGIGEPLRSYIRDAVIQIKRGLDIQEALDILNMKVGSEQFQDFIINIQQVIKSKGDLITLLSNLEDEFYRLEEEYSRRKISTYQDIMIVFIAMIMVLLVAFFFLKLNPNVAQYYLTTGPGKILISIFSIMFFAAFVYSLSINKFNY